MSKRYNVRTTGKTNKSGYVTRERGREQVSPTVTKLRELREESYIKRESTLTGGGDKKS